MSFLKDVLKIEDSVYEEATGSTVTEGFQAMESGAYKGKVKEIILFQGNFGTELRANFEIDGKNIGYRRDVGKTLKGGEVNQGFVNRLKSICEAANVDVNSLTVGDQTKVNSFGKECEGNFLLGVNDKPVTLLVRHSEDTSKEEGDTYRFSNDVEGVTSSGSEDEEKFLEKVEKQDGKPFAWVSNKKKTKKSAGAKADPKKADELKKLDF